MTTTISELKRRLIAIGHALDPDDKVDSRMAAAVRSFQRSRGMPVTGEIDEKTEAQLMRMPIPDGEDENG